MHSERGQRSAARDIVCNVFVQCARASVSDGRHDNAAGNCGPYSVANGFPGGITPPNTHTDCMYIYMARCLWDVTLYTYTFSDVRSSDGRNSSPANQPLKSSNSPSVRPCAAISRHYIISSGKPRLNATSNPPAAGSLASVRARE